MIELFHRMITTHEIHVFYDIERWLSIMRKYILNVLMFEFDDYFPTSCHNAGPFVSICFWAF